ncbi:MAG: mercury resistance system transport protein MerF [Nitrospirae bacterium]|nr:MAG: mercury resistance system transport protein MerF [Nitrospirota bacterium]
MNAKRLVVFGLAGTGLTAICCFTPILVGLLGLVGLGAVTGYLDYVLLPALTVFLGLALYGLSRRDQEDGSLCCKGKEQARFGRTEHDD